MIVSNSRALKRGKESEEVKGVYGKICGEEEGKADYEGIVQPSQQHVAPCVKVAALGTRGLGMLATFWAGIPVVVTQETGVVPRCSDVF